MIKRVTDINTLSGVNSPLFPLIYTDFHYPSCDSDGVFEGVFKDKREFVLSLKNGTATIVKTDGITEADVLDTFLSFWNVKSVISDFKLHENGKEYPFLMKATSYGKTEGVEKLSNSSKFGDYEEIYSLLNSNGDNFPQWFTSFSRKINKNDAVCTFVREENTIKSVCVVNSIFGDKAIISGVATNPQSRNKGYASRCIKAALNELYKRNINTCFLWCEPSVSPLYEKLGFKKITEIYIEE